jgi:hypothetical protein
MIRQYVSYLVLGFALLIAVVLLAFITLWLTFQFTGVVVGGAKHHQHYDLQRTVY